MADMPKTQRDFYWTSGQLYAGPAGLAQYGKYQQMMLGTLDLLFAHVERQSMVLQAGGHLGLMALALARFFIRVYTVEVADDNYAWLCANVAAVPWIVPRYGALGDGHPVALVRHKYSAEHHAKGPGTVPCYRIDDLGLPRLDAIVLDLEGGELVALEHATATLAASHPVLVVENYPRWIRRYGHAVGDLPEFLAPLGYVEVGATIMDSCFVWSGDGH